MQGADPPLTSQGDASSPHRSAETGVNSGTNNNAHNNKSHENHKSGGGNTHSHRDPAKGGAGELNATRSVVRVPRNAVECVICADPCRALCVFGCGHFTCYSCGLRIHAIQGGACPICRTECAQTMITRTVSASADKFSDEEMAKMRQVAVIDRKLKCAIDGQPLARQVCKLYDYLCPADSCWRRGEQDPFFELSTLKEHLQTDHNMHYCETCLESRPVFLCEQAVYDMEALQQHLDGKCAHDSMSFTGHPQCKFCKDSNTKLFSRFYDGEALLKHMQQNHFTCDLCNRGQFTYIFFQNRGKLDQHFTQNHQVCDHPDCAHMDLMLRVFANEFDLAAHKQRAHGIKAKVVFSLGTSMGAQSSYPAGGSNGAAGRAGGGGAASANANALEITFDHIYRREITNLMPSRSGGGGGKQGGKKGGGRRTAANVPSEAGLPSQYYAVNALPILVRGDGDGADEKKGDRDDTNRYSRASAVSNRAAPAVKKSVHEQGQALDAIINRELRSPLALASFRRYTAEFLQSRLMTSEYYTALATECFPDPSVLAEVMPLLIGTTPVESKRTSLGEYWRVKQAPETQRMLRQKHEDDAKQREIDEQQRIWDELKRAQTRPKVQTHKNNGKGRAWQARGGGAATATHNTYNNDGGIGKGALVSSNQWSAHVASPNHNRKGGRGATANAWSSGPSAAVLLSGDRGVSSPPPAAAGAASSPSLSSPVGSGGGVWGGAVAATSRINSSPAPAPAPSGTDLSSQELYPSLPTRASRLNAIGLVGKGNQKKNKPNAWFS